MSDFLSQLQMVEEAVKGATKGFMAKLDSVTFKMTIGGLKSNDPTAAMISIEQLAKEKREISIPPLYVVARGHPVQQVRDKAEEALKQLDKGNEIPALVKGKEVKEAVVALVARFGNFKKL